MKGSAGFLLLEVLIASLILSSSIAASFYLFRLGYIYLKRAEESNFLVSKLPQAISYLMNVAELEKEGGKLSLGKDSELVWRAIVEEKTKFDIQHPKERYNQPYELYLYKVNFTLRKGEREREREYQIKLLRFKMLEKKGLKNGKQRLYFR